MSSQLTPNVWNLIAPPSVATNKISLICPGEATQFIEVRKPIHILHLPTACSAASSHFHLLSHYENAALEVNISLDMANLNMINISSLNIWVWQHLDKHWESATTFGQHNLSSIRTTLQPHNYRHSTHYIPFIYRVNRRYRFNLDTVLTYRSLCDGYRIM